MKHTSEISCTNSFPYDSIGCSFPALEEVRNEPDIS